MMDIETTDAYDGSYLCRWKKEIRCSYSFRKQDDLYSNYVYHHGRLTGN